MNPIGKNIIAVVVGLLAGGAVNMGLVMTSPYIIPPPEGVDVSNLESINASIHLFEPKHFVFPFLAHALGTLVGAFVAYILAASHRAMFAFVIGLVFLAGGISACYMINAPLWFEVLDLVASYIPMAWIASLLGSQMKGGASR